ncbi:hypothetical protein ABFT80_18295 [Mesorhizobium sp. SB112]|uniref:hypothetical protein n=1 Tax=Mesorhizobium sp. SB112 TaxID=3151853 RepID=UPI003264CAB8
MAEAPRCVNQADRPKTLRADGYELGLPCTNHIRNRLKGFGTVCGSCATNPVKNVWCNTLATLFDDALDEKRLLRPAFLLARGFKAQILPDVLDRAAFLVLAGIAGSPGRSVSIFHAEFGKRPEKTTSIEPVRAWDDLFQVFHEDVILEFSFGPLCVWLPAGERFHVVFGSKEMIDQLGNMRDQAGSFSAFVDASHLTEKGKQFLREAYKRYTI